MGQREKRVSKRGKIEKGETKQSLVVDTKPLKIFSNGNKSQPKKASSSSSSAQDKTKWKVSLKKRQEKKYFFLDSDVSSMLDEFLKSKLIQLSDSKRPEEANRVNDPNYYKYQR